MKNIEDWRDYRLSARLNGLEEIYHSSHLLNQLCRDWVAPRSQLERGTQPVSSSVQLITEQLSTHHNMREEEQLMEVIREHVVWCVLAFHPSGFSWLRWLLCLWRS